MNKLFTQVLLIRLETRLEDWREGFLNDKGLLKRLGELAELPLITLSSAPPTAALITSAITASETHTVVPSTITTPVCTVTVTHSASAADAASEKEEDHSTNTNSHSGGGLLALIANSISPASTRKKSPVVTSEKNYLDTTTTISSTATVITIPLPTDKTKEDIANTENIATAINMSATTTISTPPTTTTTTTTTTAVTKVDGEGVKSVVAVAVAPLLNISKGGEAGEVGGPASYWSAVWDASSQAYYYYNSVRIGNGRKVILRDSTLLLA